MTKYIFDGKTVREAINNIKRRRITELKEVIERYLDSNRFIPLSFLEEYNELVKDLPIED